MIQICKNPIITGITLKRKIKITTKIRTRRKIRQRSLLSRFTVPEPEDE
jgi:hypothetical protein